MAPQRGGWAYCRELWYFSQKYAICLPYMWLALPYLCTHVVNLQCFCHTFAYANGVSLHLLVPPVLLLALHNSMYCGIDKWAYFREKSILLQQLHSKKGVGLFPRVGYYRNYSMKKHWVFVLSHRQWPVACAWIPVKCAGMVFTQDRQMRSTTALSPCWRRITTRMFSYLLHVYCIFPYTIKKFTVAPWGRLPSGTDL